MISTPTEVRQQATATGKLLGRDASGQTEVLRTEIGRRRNADHKGLMIGAEVGWPSHERLCRNTDVLGQTIGP